MNEFEKIISDFLELLHDEQLSKLHFRLFKKNLERGLEENWEYHCKLERKLSDELFNVLK